MISYPQFRVLKTALTKAHRNENGVRIEAWGTTICEISRIKEWKESYGQFAVYETEDTAIIFNSADILFVDGSQSTLILKLKMANPPASRV